MRIFPTKIVVVFFLLVTFSVLAVAQSFTFSITTYDENFVNLHPVCASGVPIQLRNYVQVIVPGTNGILDPPDGTPLRRGFVSNDDFNTAGFQIGQTTNLAGSFTANLEAWPANAGYDPRLLIAGSTYYLRIWNDPINPPMTQFPVPVTARYADSGPLIVPNGPIDQYLVHVLPSNENPNWQVVPVTAIPEQDDPIVPTRYTLSAYPNPFNSTTTISYSLPSSGRANIKVVDILGQEIQTIVSDQFLNQGNYSISWNASNRAAGTYFIQLQTGNQLHTQKIILLK